MNEPRKPATPIVVERGTEKAAAQAPSPPDGCIYGCITLVGLSVVLVVIGVVRRLVVFAFW